MSLILVATVASLVASCIHETMISAACSTEFAGRIVIISLRDGRGFESGARALGKEGKEERIKRSPPFLPLWKDYRSVIVGISATHIPCDRLILIGDSEWNDLDSSTK